MHKTKLLKYDFGLTRLLGSIPFFNLSSVRVAGLSHGRVNHLLILSSLGFSSMQIVAKIPRELAGLGAIKPTKKQAIWHAIKIATRTHSFLLLRFSRIVPGIVKNQTNPNFGLSRTNLVASAYNKNKQKF